MNKSKKCFKCKVELPLSDFYKHKLMKDGRLNKCKACAKKDAMNYRLDNIDRIRAYDRKRGNRQSRDYLVAYRAAYPNKYRAVGIVNHAVRDGRLFKEPCEVCGAEISVHAHHDDYLKPLNIRWLCAVHHGQWHAKGREGENGS